RMVFMARQALISQKVRPRLFSKAVQAVDNFRSISSGTIIGFLFTLTTSAMAAASFTRLNIGCCSMMRKLANWRQLLKGAAFQAATGGVLSVRRKRWKRYWSIFSQDPGCLLVSSAIQRNCHGDDIFSVSFEESGPVFVPRHRQLTPGVRAGCSALSSCPF